MKIKVFDSKTLKNVIEINLALVTRIQNECIIGRSPESGLVLDSPDVSRMHGKFLLENGNYYFCDLGSRNGSLINGKIAETSHKYLLNIGDTIRLGEFVLILEEVNAQPEELAETVYKSFDATVVSSLRDSVNLNQPPAVNQVPEVVSNVPEAIISTPEEVTIYQEVTNVQPQEDVLVSKNVVETPAEIAQVVEAVSQPIELIEVADTSENINQVIESEETESVVPIAESSTTTLVIELEETSSIEELISQNVGQSTIQDVPEEITSTTELSPELNVSEVTVVFDTTETDEVEVLSSEIIATTPAIAQVDEIIEVTIIQTTEKIPADEAADLLSSKKVSDISQPEVSQPEEVSNIQALETTNDVSSELKEIKPLIQVPSEISKVEENSDIVDDIETTDAEITAVYGDGEIKPAEVTDVDSSKLQESTSDSEKPKIISTKYIALIAHDSKRWELAQFVTKHQEFFSKCLTIAPLSVSEILSSHSGIITTEQISAATSGGYQTIAAKVASGDILAVIFLRDFLQASGVANEEAMLRVCNINQVMVATNLPTAEAIVSYIQFSGGM
jgi:methylglyoxal synthase